VIPLYCLTCGRKLIQASPLASDLVCICCMRSPERCDCTPRDENGGKCETYHKHDVVR
jgi:hypothetical protein